MKSSFKALVLAASLSMIAGAAFADPVDLSSVKDVTLDFAGRNDAMLAIAIDLTIVGDDNVGMINQSGDLNFAQIDQSGGTGNMAVVLQDASNNLNTAVVAQVGNTNRAVVFQH